MPAPSRRTVLKKIIKKKILPIRRWIKGLRPPCRSKQKPADINSFFFIFSGHLGPPGELHARDYEHWVRFFNGRVKLVWIEVGLWCDGYNKKLRGMAAVVVVARTQRRLFAMDYGEGQLRGRGYRNPEALQTRLDVEPVLFTRGVYGDREAVHRKGWYPGKPFAPQRHLSCQLKSAAIAFEFE